MNPDSLESMRSLVTNLSIRDQIVYLGHLKRIVFAGFDIVLDPACLSEVGQLWLINASLSDRQEALRRTLRDQH